MTGVPLSHTTSSPNLILKRSRLIPRKASYVRRSGEGSESGSVTISIKGAAPDNSVHSACESAHLCSIVAACTALFDKALHTVCTHTWCPACCLCTVCSWLTRGCSGVEDGIAKSNANSQQHRCKTLKRQTDSLSKSPTFTQFGMHNLVHA